MLRVRGVGQAISLGNNVRARRPRITVRRHAAATAVYAVAVANVVVIVWLWVHGGNLHSGSTGEALTSAGRITGLLSAYLALIQVVLLARLPVLERAVGFDRLTRLASLERPPVHRPRRRARRSDRMGLCADGQGAGHQGDLDDARRRRLSRHDHGDDRHCDAHRRRRDLSGDRATTPQLRVVVRRSPSRLRRNRSRRGSTRSRPATSSCSTRPPPTTGAASSSRRSRSS